MKVQRTIHLTVKTDGKAWHVFEDLDAEVRAVLDSEPVRAETRTRVVGVPRGEVEGVGWSPLNYDDVEAHRPSLGREVRRVEAADVLIDLQVSLCGSPLTEAESARIREQVFDAVEWPEVSFFRSAEGAPYRVLWVPGEDSRECVRYRAVLAPEAP